MRSTECCVFFDEIGDAYRRDASNHPQPGWDCSVHFAWQNNTASVDPHMPILSRHDRAQCDDNMLLDKRTMISSIRHLFKSTEFMPIGRVLLTLLYVKFFNYDMK